MVEVGEDLSLKVPLRQSGEEARRLTGSLATAPDCSAGRLPLRHVKMCKAVRLEETGSHWGPVKGHGLHDTRVEPSAGGARTPQTWQQPFESER